MVRSLGLKGLERSPDRKGATKIALGGKISTQTSPDRERPNPLAYHPPMRVALLLGGSGRRCLASRPPEVLPSSNPSSFRPASSIALYAERRHQRAGDGAWQPTAPCSSAAEARARCTRSSTGHQRRSSGRPRGHDRQRPHRAERRRVSRRRAVRAEIDRDPALRQHRGACSTHPPKPVVVNDRFRSERITAGSSSRFGPDGMLYVPVGAPCNVCERDPPITRRSSRG